MENLSMICFQSVSLEVEWSNYTHKEHFNIDGRQFHQYQQSEQSPLTLTHWTQKRLRHMTLEIQVLTWGMHTKKAGLTRLIRSQPWKWFARNQENMFWYIDMSMNCCFSELTLKKTNKHGGLDKIKIFSSQSHMDGGLDKTKIFSSQSDMVGWTK